MTQATLMMGAFGLLVIVGISLGCLNDPDAPGGGNPGNIHKSLKGISYSFRKYNMTITTVQRILRIEFDNC